MSLWLQRMPRLHGWMMSALVGQARSQAHTSSQRFCFAHHCVLFGHHLCLHSAVTSVSSPEETGVLPPCKARKEGRRRPVLLCLPTQRQESSLVVVVHPSSRPVRRQLQPQYAQCEPGATHTHSPRLKSCVLLWRTFCVCRVDEERVCVCTLRRPLPPSVYSLKVFDECWRVGPCVNRSMSSYMFAI